MSGEGAGLEEMKKELQSAAGLEETVPTVQDYLRQWADRRKDYWAEFQLSEDSQAVLTRGFWQLSGPVRIPWDDPALTTDGVRVAIPRQEEEGGETAEGYGSQGMPAPENYLKVRLRTGVERQLTVEPVGPVWETANPITVSVDRAIEFSGALVRETEGGVVIAPAREKTMLWVEHVPAAVVLTPEDESRQAEIVERMHAAIVDEWAADLGGLVDGGRELEARTLFDAGPGGVRFDRIPVLIGHPSTPIEGFLVASIPRGSWSEERLEEIVGPVEGPEFDRPVAVRFDDGDRVISVTFSSSFSHGELRLYTAPEYAGGISLTLLLLERLVAHLADERGPQPRFERRGRFAHPGEEGNRRSNAALRAALWETIEASRQETSGPGYRGRCLAMIQLAYDPEFEGVRALLDRLGEEPSAPVRQAVLRHLFKRHDERPGLKFTEPQRLEVRRAALGFLAGANGGPHRRDPSEFVRAAAVRLLARMTLNTPAGIDESVAALQVAAGKPEEEGWVKRETERTLGILLAQRRQGEAPPIRLGSGIPSQPDDWERQLEMRHFRGRRELVLGVERPGESSAAKQIGLREGEEVYAVSMGDSPVPPMALLFLHADLYDLTLGLPEQFRSGGPDSRTVLLPVPLSPSPGDIDQARSEGRRLLKENQGRPEDRMENLVVLNLRHLAGGRLEEWVPVDELGIADSPTVVVPEHLSSLSQEELTLIWITAAIRENHILFVRDVRQVDLEGKRTLLIYV